MTRTDKIDRLAENTMEVCIKVLVRREDAPSAMDDLLSLAEARTDYVTSVGAYCEAPESDDLEHVVDDVTDEALERLTK